MNLSWLKTLITIMEEKSLTGAARALEISQPAVSKQLLALEEYYGAPLLNRRRRELELTAAGRAVYRHGQRIMKEIDASLAEVRSLNDRIQGELFLEASTIPGEYVLPKLLGSFQQRYPEVRVSLDISDSREVARRVLAGEIAAGVIGMQINNPNLQREAIYNDELVVAIPRGHCWEDRETIELEEFCSAQMVVREHGSGTRAVIERWLLQQGVDPASLKYRLELGSTDAVLGAIEQGLGVSLVSTLAAEPRIRAGTLAAVRIAGCPVWRPLFLITRKKSAPDRLLQAFIDFVREAMPAVSTKVSEGTSS